MRTVAARFEDGVLKPEEPTGLAPGERVRLAVLRRSDPSRWNLARLSPTDDDHALADAGVAEWAEALAAEDRR